MPSLAKILIVDDGDTIRQVTAMILRRAGYEVESARSEEEARPLIQQFAPDLLLLDVNLGLMDGRDFCREIKSDPRTANIFVILISGRLTASADRVAGLEVGADAYLNRPVSNAELLAQINALVRIRRQEQAREMHDLVDRGIAEVSLQEAQVQVEEALRDKAVLFAHLSQEVHSSVGSILGSIQSLEAEGPLTAAQKTHLEIVKNKAEHLLFLCSDDEESDGSEQMDD